MLESFQTLRIVDQNSFDPSAYKAHLADCVILTSDNKILMQRRPDQSGKSTCLITIFGGHVEPDEEISNALIRELKEELGALARTEDIRFLGSLTEDFTNHSEVVHVHFWHDREGTITGCYEFESILFEKADDAISDPDIMDYASWAIQKSLSLGYLK